MLYWIVLFGVAFAFAYLVLFGAVPFVNGRAREFGSRVLTALNERETMVTTQRQFAPIVAPAMSAPAIPQEHYVEEPPREAPRGYSSYDGFRSFANNGALSIEDIVKGLSREPSAQHAEPAPAPAVNVEPIYEHVEPMYKNVEPIEINSIVETNQRTNNAGMMTGTTPPHVRGFAASLVEGDRVGVFAGLRQYVRGGGVSEHLISATVCLLDDVYRARIDGSACDPDIARVAARLNTGTLEKLVASLTTAIDSSYSEGVTGAKLALTRALGVLGA
jgi:hypothetical protein